MSRNLCIASICFFKPFVTQLSKLLSGRVCYPPIKFRRLQTCGYNRIQSYATNVVTQLSKLLLGRVCYPPIFIVAQISNLLYSGNSIAGFIFGLKAGITNTRKQQDTILCYECCNIAFQAVVRAGLLPAHQVPQVTNLRLQQDTILCYKNLRLQQDTILCYKNLQFDIFSYIKIFASLSVASFASFASFALK